MSKSQKLLIILGPTASGKSGLALELAKKFNGYLIAADSRQIYKHMDIATAKDEGEWKNGVFYVDGVPEYLVDFLEPDQDFSAAEYKKAALDIIKNNPGQLPIMAGGTGLYINAVADNLSFPPQAKDQRLKEKLEQRLKQEGLDSLVKELAKLDPASIKKIDQQNPRRVIRALEVCLDTGKPFSEQTKKGPRLFNVLKISLRTDKNELRQRIDQRVEEMFKQGIIKEGKELLKKGYAFDLPSMSGIGYPEIKLLLESKISEEEAKDLIKTATARYAKRQMTWFKKDSEIKWVKNKEEAIGLIKKWLKN